MTTDPEWPDWQALLTSDQRPVCSECEATMICSKNEVRVDCGNGYIKSGDEYTCPECETRVIVGFGNMWKPEKE